MSSNAVVAIAIWPAFLLLSLASPAYRYKWDKCNINMYFSTFILYLYVWYIYLEVLQLQQWVSRSIPMKTPVILPDSLLEILH